MSFSGGKFESLSVDVATEFEVVVASSIKHRRENGWTYMYNNYNTQAGLSVHAFQIKILDINNNYYAIIRLILSITSMLTFDFGI